VVAAVVVDVQVDLVVVDMEVALVVQEIWVDTLQWKDMLVVIAPLVKELVEVALVQLDQLEQVLHLLSLELLLQELLVVLVDQVYQLVLRILEMVALEVEVDFQQDLTQENTQALLVVLVLSSSNTV
jgi:hypothetical protein